jgi:hypothetical protein
VEPLAKLVVPISVQKFDPRWLAPLGYAATSACLLFLAARAITTFGGNATIGHLLNPEHLNIGSHWFVLLVTAMLLAVAVRRRSQLVILLTLQTLFVLAFIDVLRFIGTRPDKIDFRLVYPVDLSLKLAWLSAICCLVSLIVLARGRPEDGQARDKGNP